MGEVSWAYYDGINRNMVQLYLQSIQVQQFLHLKLRERGKHLRVSHAVSGNQ